MKQDEMRNVIQEALNQGCFFAASDCNFHVEHYVDEDVAWEIFQGHLLDHTQTRRRKRFESWNVFLDETSAPNIQECSPYAPAVSIKYDPADRRIHVTRNILMYAWEVYEDAPNVIRSRETRKWVPQLVVTIDPAANPEKGAADQAVLREQICHYLFLAVVGSSRLPITSIESPLPAFSLGRLGYFPGISCRATCAVWTNPSELIEQALVAGRPPLEQAKLLEMILRACAPDEVPQLAELFVQRWRAIGLAVEEIPLLVKTLFNHVALSPYTAMADHLVILLLHWATPNLLGPAPIADTFSYLLRNLARHLTAFDLVTFHNRGANYPDALLLDALLKAYLAMIERHPDEFAERVGDTLQSARAKRLRRRALRAAWLIRKQYVGLRVPDTPTSPGENQWVFPEPFVRVPEEQLLQPTKRRKTLFATGDVSERLLTEWSRTVLERSVRDLEHPAELRELGMAIYLDRPLGIFKRPGEVDRTPLLSYEAFSRKIAVRRLNDLSRWGLLPAENQFQRHVRHLLELPMMGFPATRLDGTARPGVVALEDAHKSASDFVVLRTTRQSLRNFLFQYDFRKLKEHAPDLVDWLFSAKSVLMIRTVGTPVAEPTSPFLMVFDEQMRPRIEIGLGQETAAPTGYLEFNGAEYVEQGLRIFGVWDVDRGMSDGTCKRQPVCENVMLPPKPS